MTKDEVYSILKNAEGYVSGEKISSQLGVKNQQPAGSDPRGGQCGCEDPQKRRL